MGIGTAILVLCVAAAGLGGQALTSAASKQVDRQRRQLGDTEAPTSSPTGLCHTLASRAHASQLPLSTRCVLVEISKVVLHACRIVILHGNAQCPALLPLSKDGIRQAAATAT